MTTKGLLSALSLALLICGSAVATAADKRFPDWPCQQVKVPELSIAAMWPNPIPENVTASANRYPDTADLVVKLAARRTSLEQAQKLIDSFVTGAPGEKKEKALVLFSVLFDKVSAERFQVMNGLERAYRKQKDFAQKIRADTDKLHQLQDTQGDEARIQELVRDIEWETRIFEDRRKTMTYACEVPQQMDQRLFALARVLQQAGGLS
jgi:hypothetical protein